MLITDSLRRLLQLQIGALITDFATGRGPPPRAVDKVAGMSQRHGCGVRRQAKRDAAFPDSSNPLMQQKCYPQPKRRRASLAAALHSDIALTVVRCQVR